jgi:hypothetical protein
MVYGRFAISGSAAALCPRLVTSPLQLQCGDGYSVHRSLNKAQGWRDRDGGVGNGKSLIIV